VAKDAEKATADFCRLGGGKPPREKVTVEEQPPNVRRPLEVAKERT
jgi:hypothetical protein